jgi:uncharacterized RDD family membrane protein YckC
MEYEDRITIGTPEGVDLELTLAGLGSRFAAALVDAALQIALMLALGLLFVGADIFTADALAGGIGLAAFIVGTFFVLFGYHILFETLASGRTPGKRWTGLRVVDTGGRPVTFVASAVRNLVRLVDWLPSAYVIGSISILASSKNQRLGDIAADTLVVRERLGSMRKRRPASAPFAAQAPDAIGFWDVSGVTTEEAAAVRRFLERREELTYEARVRLGDELAERLRPKVVGAPERIYAETFLEQLAAAKAARS